MSRDWDAIQGFEGWVAVLEELLQAARAAAQDAAVSKRLAAQEALGEFIDRSPNSIARRLDEIARDAMRDLFLATVEERAQSIAARTTALRGYLKDVRAAAAVAKSDAASIRLDRARGAVDSMTATIQSLKDLRDTLKDTADDKTLAASIEALIATVQTVRNAVETVRHG